MTFKEDSVQFMQKHNGECTTVELIEKAMEYGAAKATLEAIKACGELLEILKAERLPEDSTTQAKWQGLPR